jgi:hypothetical protein
MTRNLFVRSFASMVAALCLSGAALAQTGPSGPTVPPTPPTNPTVQPAGVLTEQQLEAALKALDPNYKTRPSDDGKGKVYTLTVTRDGWKYDLQIESFQNEIWVNAVLSSVISAPQNVSPGVMAELLKLNFQHGPAHFAFNTMKDNSGVKLFLCRMLDRRMTAENFNGYVEGFLKVVKDTYPTWSQVGR